MAKSKKGKKPSESVKDWSAERVEREGIKTGEDAYQLLRGILERQDGNNGPEDGEELYVFCEAFKALDEHMRTASGSGPAVWRNK